ncbi:MAG: hypothetical protein R2860_05960 [Desulfobacterales bacterium]
MIDVGVEKEACPLGLAPTTSTTALLAMGDALAVVLIDRRKFTPTDFKKFHPGGNLGHRLSAYKTKDIMRSPVTPCRWWRKQPTWPRHSTPWTGKNWALC